MNPAIERAAERLYGEFRLLAPLLSEAKPEWHSLAEGNKDIARKMVHAVIETIREPTETMIERAESADDPGSPVYSEPFVACSHEDAWKLMVDALLADVS